MKKTKKFLMVLAIVLLFVNCILQGTANAALSATVSTDVTTLKVGEDIVFSIQYDDTVVATNFVLNFNNDYLSLVGSETEGLNINEVEGNKVKCIYADKTLTGTNLFKVKFKAITKTNSDSIGLISVESPKAIAKTDEVSYKDGQIVGIETTPKITIEKKAQSQNVGLYLNYIGGILKGEKNLCVIRLPKNDSDRKMTEQELKDECSLINAIEPKVPGYISTGDQVFTTGEYSSETFNAVLYGDANGDGVVCDTDDVMVIINDYLGKTSAEGCYAMAADLNADGTLDIDDILRMFKMYLGTLSTDLVDTMPDGAIEY